MAGYDVSVGRDLLPGLLSGQDGLAKLVEAVLNQILEAQVTEALGAERHERTEERAGYRNGTRARTLYTRVGPVTLLVPQTRDGSFSTEIFKRYQRSEQAFVLALMEMVVQGVSTRKVSAITEELCGTSFSKSTVSALCAGLDGRVGAFNERRLEGDYPFVLVDALFIKSREGDRVVSRAALVVSGIRSDGYREILGVKIGDTESFATWDETFRWLKGRGLKGVMFVVSDSHGGLTQAVAKHFQGVTWQRCQVHLMRNILGSCSAKIRADVAAAAKLVFQAADMAEAKRRLAEFVERFEKTAAKAVACIEEGFADAMAVMALPEKYRRRLRTTNMQERLNEEIRRRERVIRIFPNDESALRLIGALLAEQNEVWQERRYLDMDEFAEWVAARAAAGESNNVVALAG
ncbi:IS256 family transposase [Aromatoleum bremense]|uniref:Mutator family transposase n=1 Tax=Aromatoleum bremense TaxID=76115 RepID=A0ABX1P168_9RHOO|nr:IS256 family transposase [Aromatoleum bremense]NMG17858.1 IS256 family transposase [Aromatoleum bremense]QTQ30068.1 Transposase, mutator type [Aromatoleum bremense]QTQ30920.1 Transposase, mutator type [Aromatoleum bremense]QTQ31899.1 Transposase, mutator type [Aromatoleum bremense]QTQ32501.1 Transposase, mutator type [Aromatoleum bremense]